MLTLNNAGQFVLYAREPALAKRAETAALTLSIPTSSARGFPVYFTDCRYAVLQFWPQADEAARAGLVSLRARVEQSFRISPAANIRAVPPGCELMPFQGAGIDYALSQPGGVLIGDEMGLGKAQPTVVPVLTPSGWRKIGDLRVGDPIIGADGREHRVTGVYPQGIKPSYRVTFRDGTSAQCGLEHLWAVKDDNRAQRGQPWAVKTLEELLKRGIHTKAGHNKWMIPVMEPAQFPAKKFALDPWLVGALIGNGGLTQSAVLTICDQDLDTLMRATPSASSHAARPGCWVLGFSGVMPEIRRLGMDVKSAEKAIPEEYKWGSVEQRLDLLRGLMDTDGSCVRNRTTYHTISRQLAFDVAELVRSLGGTAIERWYDRSAEGKPDECQVNVRMLLCPFSCVRKASCWAPSAYAKDRRISAVEQGADCEQVCIAVSAPDRLYVCEHFICTHNTVQAIVAANEMQAKRVLAVVPGGTRRQWADMVRVWAYRHNPHIHVIYKGADTIAPKAHWTIISYNLLNNETLYNRLLREYQPELLILDEAHYLKTVDSRRTRAVFGRLDAPGSGLSAKVEKVICLTGTPLPNRPKEGYTMARSLAHESIDFMSEKGYGFAFNPSIRTTELGNDGTWRHRFLERSGRLLELQARFRGNFMVRRLETNVQTQLPKERYHITYLEPDGDIRKVLKAEEPLLLRISDFEDLEGLDIAEKAHISVLRREMGVAKVPRVLEHVRTIMAGGDGKLVIFSFHRDVIRMLQEGLKDYSPVIYWGGMSSAAQEASKRRFTQDPKCRVFNGQILAAGTGVDGLQAVCSHVLFAEFSWVPGENAQAVMRLKRIGQARSVLAEFAIAPSGLCERILASSLDKLATTTTALD